ncbi:MAG: membrane protein insertion efficiency factor YidD [Bacilli bacterium]|nr:membrane protein insertion efficiency factor YidD [Bacilli bacterium]
MKKILIFLIKTYQITPLHSHSLCRFTPTCSQYMIDAIEKYGVIKGIRLGIKRILKCHPKGKYGYDPVK